MVDKIRCGIVVNTPIAPRAGTGGHAESLPRKDYLLLSEALDAQITNFAPRSVHKTVPRSGLAFWLAQAWNVFQRRDEYDVILSMSEQVGLWLALLFKLARCNKPHVMISHNLTPRKKSLLLRFLHVDSHITKFVCYGSAQSAFLTRDLRIPFEKVEVVPHAVDSLFWRPLPLPTERLITSAGLTSRDYPTLLRAIADVDVDLAIAAASPWTTSHNGKRPGDVPANVKIVRCTPLELRDLYARSLFVVVPLPPRNSQAGSLVIYEAMAMGKAVVTTRNGGQVDIVEEGVTGSYVPAGDASALRQVITHLLEHPREAHSMGAKARKIV